MHMQYSALVKVYETLETNSKRLTKTYHIAELLKKTPADDLNVITLLVQGRIFPTSSEEKIGVASQIVIKAISKSTGEDIKKIEQKFKKIGDLGKVAEELTKTKTQSTLFSNELTVKKVFDNLKKLTELTGTGSIDKKISLISELLTSAKPEEAKYIVKTVLEQMRIGVGEGSMRDSIVWAFFEKQIELKFDENENKATYNEKFKDYINLVQGAFDLTNDFGEVAYLAKTKQEKGLEKTSIKVGVPIKCMLAIKEDTILLAFERVGLPTAVEYKYDGFRMQVHKDGDKVTLFTRRLENVTTQFPDVVERVKKDIKTKECILDCEAVGFDPKTLKYKPFQEISQRIRRKYDIEKLEKELPVELVCFDIFYHNGENLLHESLEKRQKILKKIINDEKRKLIYVEQIITDKEKDAEKFYKQSLKDGNEGVMFKKLDAPYKPGARVGFMVKYKPIMEPLDVVIVGGEWGTGKRAGYLSSFIIAIKKGSEFLEIGKVGTGFKEVEKEHPLSLDNITKLLKPFIIPNKSRIVEIKPKVVIEVSYEEIQKSPTYSSGFALRFPRVTALREDKPADEVNDLKEIEYYYEQQRGKRK